MRRGPALRTINWVYDRHGCGQDIPPAFIHFRSFGMHALGMIAYDQTSRFGYDSNDLDMTMITVLLYEKRIK